MLIQRSLTIHNGCQHKDVHADFLPGKTYAITGKNACGKTNFLQLNMYGLLGSVNKSWGSQKDFNRNGTKDGYVEVHLYDTSKFIDIYVRRHFTAGTKNPDRLWYRDTNHDPDIMGRDAVNDALERDYGNQIKILFELLWMRQGMSNWLLTASSTSIYTFLNSIFDTSHFKKIREELMDAANSIALYEVDHARLEYLNNAINNIKSVVYEDTEPLLVQLEQARESLSKVSTSTMTKAEKASRISVLKVLLKDTEHKLETAKRNIEEIDNDPVPWLTAVHTEFVRQFDNVKEQVVSVMNEATQEKYKLSKLDRDIERVKGILVDVVRHIQEVDTYIESFMSSDNCPLCASRVTDKEHFSESVSRVFTGGSYSEFRSRRSSLESELDILIKDRASVSARVKELESNVDTLSKYISDNQTTRDKIEEAVSIRNMWEYKKTNRPTYESVLKMSQDTINSTNAKLIELESTPTSSEDDERIVTSLKKTISDLEHRISSINAEKTSNNALLKSFTDELALRESDRQKNEKNQEMFNRLMRVREGTSNKRIPARYLNDKVDAINAELEAYCRMADLNVILFLDKDDFVFRFTNGSDVRPAGQLSGAQQTLCSTILQLALVRVVSPKLGVIQMDEPTVFLDPTNRAKLLSLFENLSAALSATGTITLVPTHDVDLMGACNERIEL